MSAEREGDNNEQKAHSNKGRKIFRKILEKEDRAF